MARRTGDVPAQFQRQAQPAPDLPDQQGALHQRLRRDQQQRQQRPGRCRTSHACEKFRPFHNCFWSKKLLWSKKDIGQRNSSITCYPKWGQQRFHSNEAISSFVSDFSPICDPHPHRTRDVWQGEKWLSTPLFALCCAAPCVNTLLGNICFHLLHCIT